MRFFSAATALLASVAAVSAGPLKRQAGNSTTTGNTITVLVGQNGTLTYSPSNVTANVGDTIAFQFVSKNHTVTQSTFAAPCEKMTTPAAGIDSGFMFVAANATQFPQWSFTVTNASAPLWFYCRQKSPVNHCESGMVFSVNANPDSAKSFDAFQQAAKASANGTAAANGTTSASGAAPSGAAATGASSSASGSAAPAASSTSGSLSLRASGSAAGILTVVGLVAGLVL
ncbi:hypothetical protein PUNSTDRAFT_53578 [Punctularia strigosozonata HHB-11173 SS5]|uniref:uncharacterized protein n=1 Tax=Punctularia strigosozonata (strain HHB-11173) TaxID=741275 RepID=UPI0004418132|nr:uncharacterized protein PUNSTDRAFT_53578 [Punctularia strigosozonata HHB-11173 SS5]EIN07206.1 hypothetical protein PUNSTDRAFT_53578 [Punctularia strigosozonata HHB-11173 SS5]